MTLLFVALILVTIFYGAEVGNQNKANRTEVCIAVTCNMDSQGTEGTTAVRVKHQRPSLGP